MDCDTGDRRYYYRLCRETEERVVTFGRHVVIFEKVEMLVTTTRSRSSVPGQMFSGERGLTPSFADITVSIPPGKVRKIGEVSWPKRLPSNPLTDFAVLKADALTLDGAKSWLNATVKKNPDRSVIVFIHGFNNRFEDAVYRFAQIMQDSGIPNTPVLVTWPSRGSLLAYGNGRLPAKFKNVMLADADVDVDVFRSQIADMGPDRPQFTLFVSRDDRALALSRRVWGDIPRIGSIDPEQSPYKEELAANKIAVIDLTKIKAGDRLHHSKFAQSPQIAQLIGARISQGQTLTDSRVGLGDKLLAATTGTAAAAGSAAGLILSAPIAVVDQNTRDNYANHIARLGGQTAARNRCKPNALQPTMCD